MRRTARALLAAAARAAEGASTCSAPSSSARPLVTAAGTAWPASSARLAVAPAGASSSSSTTLHTPSPAAAAAATRPGGLRATFASSAPALPPHTPLTMPALSPTMSAGNIAAWHVGVGDAVAPGSLLADVETDKATLGWESMEDGVVAALLVPAGARDVPVGTTVAVLVEDAGDVGAFADYKAEAVAAPAAAAAPAPPAPAATPSASSPTSSTTPARRIGPAAARVLRQAGLDGAGLAASGPRGALTKADALAAVAGGGGGRAAAAPGAAAAAAPAAAAPARPAATAAPRPAPTSAALPPPRPGMAYEDLPHTQVRRVIAARLSESKATVPHAYVRGSAGTAAVHAARAALAASTGAKASVNDFVIAAAARALADVPALNVRWDEGASAPVPVPGIDVAIAVATPGGLITPIITGAASRSVPDIAAAVKDLAGRARAGKLAPHEFQGGSFSISNLGMYGVASFSAIINPPQAAILAVGAAAPDPVWPAGADAVAFVDRLAVTLSFDARAVAPQDAAAWLDAFAAHLESPEGLLVDGGGGAAAAAAAA